MADDSRILFTADAHLSVTKPEGHDGPGTLTGYALVWNVPTRSGRKFSDGYPVELAPGSATFSTPTFALMHHDFQKVIGSTKNNTLRLTPDERGVKVEIDLPNNTLGRDVAESVGRGDIDGMSFQMVKDPVGRRVTRPDGRRVFSATHYEVSEVTVTAIPAFQGTSVAMKTVGRQFSSYDVDEVAAAAIRLNQLKLKFLSQPAGTRPRRVK